MPSDGSITSEAPCHERDFNPLLVAVCIVGFNNVQDIKECLRCLESSTYRSFELVICENGSAASYEALHQHLPEALPNRSVTLIHAPENPGYAGGVNRCIAKSSNADAWWILNPDARPEANALERLVARLRQGDADAVGGRLYYSDGRLQALGGRYRTALARVEAIGKGLPVCCEVDASKIESMMNFLHGASMLVSRRFVELTGPMREDYFLYCEEVEWCLRALKRGLKLGFEPSAFVLHDQGSTTGSAADIRERPWLPIFLDERNKLLVARDINPIALSTAIPAALALIILRFARRGAWAQFGYGLQGWIAGILGKRGKPAAVQSGHYG